MVLDNAGGLKGVFYYNSVLFRQKILECYIQSCKSKHSFLNPQLGD